MMTARRRRRNRAHAPTAAAAAAALAVALLALVALVATGAAAAASTTSTTTSSTNNGQSTATRSSSSSVKGPGQGPAVASASSSSTGGGGAGGELPPPGGCVVASASEGQACADGAGCCQVRQETRLCMPSWARPDARSAPPPPIPRAYAAVAGGPAVPCCVMLADTRRGGGSALVPFCAAEAPSPGGRDDPNVAFFQLPSGAVVTRVNPSCAAGARAPSGFKHGTVACTVAFPEGVLPAGFAAPPGDYSRAEAPLVVDVPGSRAAAPCALGYTRLSQVASVVPPGKEGPDGEPAGTLRVTSKCE